MRLQTFLKEKKPWSGNDNGECILWNCPHYCQEKKAYSDGEEIIKPRLMTFPNATGDPKVIEMVGDIDF